MGNYLIDTMKYASVILIFALIASSQCGIFSFLWGAYKTYRTVKKVVNTAVDIHDALSLSQLEAIRKARLGQDDGLPNNNLAEQAEQLNELVQTVLEKNGYTLAEFEDQLNALALQMREVESAAQRRRLPETAL